MDYHFFMWTKKNSLISFSLNLSNFVFSKADSSSCFVVKFCSEQQKSQYSSPIPVFVFLHSTYSSLYLHRYTELYKTQRERTLETIWYVTPFKAKSATPNQLLRYACLPYLNSLHKLPWIFIVKFCYFYFQNVFLMFGLFRNFN